MKIICPECNDNIFVDEQSVYIDRRNRRVVVKEGEIVYCDSCKRYVLKSGDTADMQMRSEVSYSAKVQGGGTVAQGRGAVAVGRDVISIHGNGNAIGNNNRTRVTHSPFGPSFEMPASPFKIHRDYVKGDGELFSWKDELGYGHKLLFKSGAFKHTVIINNKVYEV